MSRGRQLAAEILTMQPLELVNLKDIIIDFTQEEWSLLDTYQRKLFSNVMLENISHLVSVGHQVCKSDVCSQLEQGVELWREGIGFFQSQNSGREIGCNKEVLSMKHICRKYLSVIMSSKQTSHTQKNGNTCSELLEDFTHSSRVTQHVLIHNGKKHYFSNLFGKALSEQSFNQQKQICTRSKSCECHLNGKSCFQISALIHHNGSHTQEKPHGCHICGKVFTQHSALKQHMRIHIGEKPYGCQLCGKAFTHHSCLREHKRTHTGEKPYECYLCGKAFTQSNKLREHERTHTGEKPYECHLCRKAFTHFSNFRQHEKTHAGEKPYKCHLCAKAFTWCSGLREHERTHTGEKPYDCHLCGKTFTHCSSLRQHEKIHTGEKPYKCHLCGVS
ncbi:zinc finger protein 596-like isoform X2 [Choloepus didactylus]|uniref:zinc finger protein 596-like isoform X2 n=1 Tax=Choloepus didactylus TaxID=27675 RepID=UPI00189D7F76|nr:zinc finger protein 596-like isoform X2 [Choloepus didactylus]